jgi:hypothetical protein
MKGFTMESNELAKKMIEWGELKAQMDALENEIKTEVLAIGKTQTVGNVRATFSNPRKTYQGWDAAVMEAEPEGLDQKAYEVVTVTIDWQKAAADYGIERKSWIDENAKPSVTVKTV